MASEQPSADTDHVGPIIFGRKEPREQLLNNGLVYSFRRRKRTTGETWARASRTGKKIADVKVEHVCEIPAPNVGDLADLWIEYSGFETEQEWWNAIEDVHGSVDVGHIYKCTLHSNTEGTTMTSDKTDRLESTTVVFDDDRIDYPQGFELTNFDISENEHIVVNVYDNNGDGTPKDKYIHSATGRFALILDQSTETDTNQEE